MGLWDIKPQVILLIAAFVIGLVTGFIFDIYRRLRKLFSPGPFMTALGDLCFWGIITIITFVSYLKITLGQVRGYVFFGIAAGLLLYLYLISRHVIVFFILLDNLVIRVFQKVKFIVRRAKRIRMFSLPKRIWMDFCRMFSKMRKK